METLTVGLLGFALVVLGVVIVWQIAPRWGLMSDDQTELPKQPRAALVINIAVWIICFVSLMQHLT